MLSLPQAADPSKGAVEAAAPDGNQGSHQWVLGPRGSQMNPLSSSSFQPSLGINSHMGLGMHLGAGKYCLKAGEGSA